MSLKDFVILSKLGEGAYSSVYKVQRIADSQTYALKKVKMATLSEKEQENALNEVRILASVKCPYIIGYKQAFIESNSLWYCHPHAALLWSFPMTATSTRKSCFTRRRKLSFKRTKFGRHSSTSRLA